MEDRFSFFDPSGAELEFDDGQDRKYNCDHTHNDHWCLNALACTDDTSEGIYGIGKRYPCMDLTYEFR